MTLNKIQNRSTRNNERHEENVVKKWARIMLLPDPSPGWAKWRK